MKGVWALQIHRQRDKRRGGAEKEPVRVLCKSVAFSAYTRVLGVATWMLPLQTGLVLHTACIEHTAMDQQPGVNGALPSKDHILCRWLATQDTHFPPTHSPAAAVINGLRLTCDGPEW